MCNATTAAARSRGRSWMRYGILALTAVLSAAAVDARQFGSHDAAYSLARALERSGLDAIAAAVPDEPGTYVAALYLPGRALLVVSARHPSIERITSQVAMRRYRQVYMDLLSTQTPQGKFYIQDANADGILSALPGSGAVDILREDNARQTLFNGDTESQGLTVEEYDARLAAADARYAQLLAVVASAVQK
jgi:hypothetical protein